MTIFPCCKINLGLNVVSKRADGYHDIQTVFYPVPLSDAIEVKKMDENFPSEVDCDLKTTGNVLECGDDDNLVVKAYNMLACDYELPRVHVHLWKHIPSQAGLGGGSSDAAYMIRLLDERFRLNMGIAEMEMYASKLGSDCPFFITAEQSYATGRGEVLSPLPTEHDLLGGYYLLIVKPDVCVSTAEAFSNIVPKEPLRCCKDIVMEPVETWRNNLSNDFETTVFAVHPSLAVIKDELYRLGAVYAQMSGSGSALFGIFRNEPMGYKKMFSKCFTYITKIE